ncbi:rCG57175 [Rattus norvegicus]|uniref:RCG57175 n=1 Tax=Rattus norvegicus TaxID=10116 RepID=A6KPF5_RAT|nr:rCG57175 [Rattus norvegicus]
MARTMDRLEACNSPGTSGTPGDALPGPRVYARRWVFLLVVSLLSCSNAMVQGCWAGGAGSFLQPQRQLFSSRKTFLWLKKL